MKIKTKKKMYIGGLLEHVRKNELRGRYFRVMDESRYIKVTPDGDIYFDVDFRFKPDDTFTVEVEEELTEETEFGELWVLSYNRETQGYHIIRRGYLSILEAKAKMSIEGLETFAIYRKDTLIWTKESGIPESGVLEVDTE